MQLNSALLHVFFTFLCRDCFNVQNTSYGLGLQSLLSSFLFLIFFLFVTIIIITGYLGKIVI